MRYGSEETVRAVLLGALLATLNVLAGYAAAAYAAGKPATTFFKVVLGGMGVRLFGLAGILAVLIRFAGIAPGALVGSMAVCYPVFLTLEILYIQKTIGTRQQSQ